MVEKKPFEIARETLMLLAGRKLTPTPANYQTIYNEIAGTPDRASFPEAQLRRIAQLLPAKTPEQKKAKEQLDRAIEQNKWDGVQGALVALAAVGQGSLAPHASAGAAGASTSGSVPRAVFSEILARLIENALPALGGDDEKFAEHTAQLLKALRDSASEMSLVRALVGSFTHRLSFVAEDQAEIRGTLLKLLHLIVQNIGELGMEERWLAADFDALIETTVPPLTLRRLDELERRLKSVLFKQIEAKSRTLDAQAQMRELLAKFIERLGEITDSTGAFSTQMARSAQLMEQAQSLEEATPVMRGVVICTADIVRDVGAMRDELREMRDKADAAEAALAKLHEELNSYSAQARHDTLTRTLNRLGLEEALVRELEEVRRKETPLCVALLDVDNFKAFNEAKGYETGNSALTHLVSVTRECMRTQDTLARYGGEEFVILMPDTTLDQGLDAMTRLQRALTRHFFLAGAEKIVITFSAGVAQFAPGESGKRAIERADQAMYLAKRAGKNRVLAA